LDSNSPSSALIIREKNVDLESIELVKSQVRMEFDDNEYETPDKRYSKPKLSKTRLSEPRITEEDEALSKKKLQEELHEKLQPLKYYQQRKKRNYNINLPS
jgi:hypothetical protein